MRRLVVLAVVVLMLSSVGPGVLAADEQVIGRPSLSLFAPENTVVPGTERPLEVYVANDGQLDRGGPARFEERVTTARGVRLEFLDTDAPITVRSGTVPVGTVTEGVTGPVSVRVAVNADAEPGTYEIPVRLTYAYTRVVTYDAAVEEASPAYSEARITHRTTLTVRVDQRPSFAVVGVESDVAVGGRGTVTVTVENVGTRTAREATVDVVSLDPEFLLAGGDTASLVAGRWAPGEVRRLTLDARVIDAATVREYPLRLAVAYDDEDGVRRTARLLTAGVVPGARDDFVVTITESDLRVGQRGEIRGTVTARGGRTISDASLRLLGPDSVEPTETVYPLGDLTANESVPFSFTVDVPRERAAGPRQFQFRVEYELRDESRISDPLSSTAPVEPYRSTVAVEAREARVTVDSDTRLVVRVTNVGGEPLTDAVAHLRVNDPLESDVTEAFVGTLEPGASTTVTFALSATDDAIPGVLPAAIEVSYTDTEGRSVVSDPETVGVTVEAEPSTLPLATVAALLVTVAGAVVWWRWRR